MGAMNSDMLTLTGFDPGCMSEFVKIVAAPTGRRDSSGASGNCFVEYIGKPDVDMHGVVFGNAPIPRFSGDAYFEITLEKVRSDEEAPDKEWADGVTLGVIAYKPDPDNKPETALDLDDGFSIGYFGGVKLPSNEDIQPVSWSPVSLSPGDRVGLMITREGAASIVINGTTEDLDGPRKQLKNWPTEEKLYAFVDLLGNAQAISLNLAAHPPRAAP